VTEVWFGLILLAIVVIGGLIWFADWMGWTNRPNVSRGYNVCARCPQVIKPGDRIVRLESGDVVHMMCL